MGLDELDKVSEGCVLRPVSIITEIFKPEFHYSVDLGSSFAVLPNSNRVEGIEGATFSHGVIELPQPVRAVHQPYGELEDDASHRPYIVAPRSRLVGGYQGFGGFVAHGADPGAGSCVSMSRGSAVRPGEPHVPE